MLCKKRTDPISSAMDPAMLRFKLSWREASLIVADLRASAPRETNFLQPSSNAILRTHLGSLPEGHHPSIEIFCAQAFDMKCRGIRIDMYILTTRGCRNGGMMKRNLVANRLPGFKRVGKDP
jgi:hypothetical protein